MHVIMFEFIWFVDKWILSRCVECTICYLL